MVALDSRWLPTSQLREFASDGIIHYEEFYMGRRIPVKTTPLCKQGQSNDK